MAAGLSIAFFGHDAADSTIAKRVTAFRAHGADVHGFMFKRAQKKDEAVAWPNIDLGVTQDLSYLRRLPKLLAAVVRCVRERQRLRDCSILYARNLDMLLVAGLARLLTGATAPIVYEVLDVRRIMIGDTIISRLMRLAERLLMRTSSLLVVSAPDYITHYFEPLQSYEGPWYLLENKLSAGPLADSTVAPAMPPAGPPWVIGWFGVLKCARSLDILNRLAEALPSRVQIHIRGIPSESDVPSSRIEAICRRLPNVIWFGHFASPHDLRDIYGRVHLTWAADFLDAGANSDWCLANRIYEGGLHGAVALAAHANATGRRVEQQRLGFTLAEPLERTAVEFMATLDAVTYAAARAAVEAAPRAHFVDESDTRDLLAHLARLARARTDAPDPAANPSNRHDDPVSTTGGSKP